MPSPYPIDKLIGDMLGASRESGGLGDLLSKSGQRLKYALDIDEVIAKETLTRSPQMGQADDVVLNTGRPYIDNRLSEYSAFPELIAFYKSGFKSCLMLPIIADGRSLGILTLLSRGEDRFDAQTQNSLSIVGSVIGTEAYMKLEKEKSLSVARYFDAAFNSILPQALIDSSGSIVKANKGLMNLVDTPAKDMQGRNMRDFFALTEVNLADLARGRPIEVRSTLYPGRDFVMTSSKASEKLMHVLIQDETEQVKLEEKARLFDYGEEVYMLLGNDFRVLWISSNSEKVLRVDPDALSGIRLTDIIANSDGIEKQLDSIPESGMSKQVRLNLGNDLFAEAKITILKNPTGYSCIISGDYEKKIATAKRFAEDLIQLSGDLVIKLDIMGSVSAFNRSAEKLLGYKNSEVASVPVSSLCADSETQSRLNEALPRAKKNGMVTGLYLSMRPRGNSDNVPIDASVLSMTDDAGVHIGYIITGKELLTKLRMEDLEKVADDAQRKLTKEAAESDLKTQFIYNISHDLKTPLTSIQGYSKLMIRGDFGAVTEDQRSALETISAESERLKQLILQILDVAKLESKKIRLDIQRVNLSDIAGNPSINALAERAKAQGLEFSINVDYNVPEVNADPNRLIQVFVNLIDNALKFTEKGSIRVNVIRKGKNVRVEVVDTGLGVKEEERAKLFKKFYQVSRKDLTMQPKAGTGLGLSIVKEIVSMHGGRVGINSGGLGKGSVFWFTIPLEKKKKRVQDEQQKQGSDNTQQDAPAGTGAE